MEKDREIFKYSNPYRVFDNALKIFGDNIELSLSPRHNKKYMIKGDFSDGKWIHFGAWEMEDFTKHKDRQRRNNFRTRNHKWKDKPENTPSFLSYHLLW